jgi:hypothetical protein
MKKTMARRAPIRRTYKPQYQERLIPEKLCSYAVHTGSNNKCQHTLAVKPDSTFPLWTTLQNRYDEYRIKMAVFTVIMEQNDKPVFSLIDRTSDVISTVDGFMKDRNHKMNVLDGDNKKITITYKPTTSTDYDFQATGGASQSAPAHIKILQDALSASAPVCEIRTTLYLQCKGQKN